MGRVRLIFGAESGKTRKGDVKFGENRRKKVFKITSIGKKGFQNFKDKT